MAVSLSEYAFMALDAYDNRPFTNVPEEPAIADPAVEEAFPRFRVEPPRDQDAVLRNATVSLPSGFEANVYIDDAAQEIVVAFRGTEFGRFLDAADDGDNQLIDEARLDKDLASLFGYYQDGGATVTGFVELAGGLDATLELAGFTQRQADLIVGALDFISIFGDPVEDLAEEGEEVVRLQAEDAINTVLAVARDAPGYTVTVTGHSLGGALSAYVAAALGVEAVVFDPAPYAEPDFLAELNTLADDLLAGEYADVDTAAAGWDPALPTLDAAASLVHTERLEGSFVPDIYLTASPLINLPQELRSDTVIGDLGEGLSSVSLHSPDLLALAVDSRERASEDRPALTELTARLPTLLARADDPFISPEDGSTDTFYRALLVEDGFYASFALAFEAIADLSEAWAPAGSGVGEGREIAIENQLILPALERLAEILGSESFDGAPGLDQFVALGGTPGNDVLVGAYGVSEVFDPGLGQDLIAPGEGAPDTVFGTLEALGGDTLRDFGPGDRLVFTDAPGGTLRVEETGSGAAVTVESGDGSAQVRIEAPIDADQIIALSEGDSTVVTILPEVLESAGALAVALLYEAAFGRPPDDAGLNFWIDERELGFSLFAVAAEFLQSEEFAARAGPVDTLDDALFVSLLYDTALGRAADDEGLAFWSDAIAQPDFGRENLLISFSESPENIASAGIDQLVEADGVWSIV